jgi:hypothetical protein
MVAPVEPSLYVPPTSEYPTTTTLPSMHENAHGEGFVRAIDHCFRSTPF